MWELLCAQFSSNDRLDGSGKQWARSWRLQYKLKNSRLRLYNSHVALACPTAKGKRLAREYRDLVKERGRGVAEEDGGGREEERVDVGSALSTQHSKTFSYGEIPFESFVTLFAMIRRIAKDPSKLKDSDFVDVGSGTGKAVFTAAMLGEFRECRGLELVENLHSEAIKMKEGVWEEKLEKLLKFPPSECVFSCGDLTVDDWAKDSVGFVYAASTMFTPDLMSCIAKKAALGLRPGAIVVTLSKALDLDQELGANGGRVADKLALRETSWLRMSWAKARIYVYERTEDF